MYLVQMKKHQLMKTVKTLRKVVNLQCNQAKELEDVLDKLMKATTRVQKDNETLLKRAQFFEQQLNSYKEENTKLKKENAELLADYEYLGDVCIQMKQATPEHFATEMEKMKDLLGKKDLEIAQLKKKLDARKSENEDQKEVIRQAEVDNIVEAIWCERKLKMQQKELEEVKAISENQAQKIQVQHDLIVKLCDAKGLMREEWKQYTNESTVICQQVITDEQQQTFEYQNSFVDTKPVATERMNKDAVTKKNEVLIEDQQLTIAQLVDENEELKNDLRKSWQEIELLGKVVYDQTYLFEHSLNRSQPVVKNTATSMEGDEPSGFGPSNVAIETNATNRKRKTAVAARRGRKGKKEKMC
ncbi:unnamed protein product [Caenorhabditis brenneri]